MRVVVQRVSQADVTIDNKVTGRIQKGFVVLLGICHEDTESDVDYLVRKIIGLRVFSDAEDKMNLCLEDVNGQCLVISQFTLFADTKKGNRPSFIRSAKPDLANSLYELFLNKMSELSGKLPEKGIFGADMKVSLINDGPVTIILDSKNKEL